MNQWIVAFLIFFGTCCATAVGHRWAVAFEKRGQRR